MDQLSAADLHCTVIQHELGEVWVQLDNTTKKKAQGSRHAFLLQNQFDQDNSEHQEKEHVAAEKEKQNSLTMP
jgi:hypothetical protein